MIDIINLAIFSINNSLKYQIDDVQYQDIKFTKIDNPKIYEINENELNSFFKGKRILISIGSTIEYIDPIRVITNTSSGKMGVSLVNNALNFGFNVTIIKGQTNFDITNDTMSSISDLKILEVKTSQQMYDSVIKELNSFYLG